MARSSSSCSLSLFQSTLSVRRATHASNASSSFCIFQSTLSVRRATWREQIGHGLPSHFNPRSP